MSENINENNVKIEVPEDVKDFFQFRFDEIIETGKVEVFKFALSLGIKPDNYYLKTAIENNQAEIVKIMLDSDIDVNDFGGEFMSEASKVGNIDIVNMLLEKGANPTDGIVGASERGHKEIVKLLINKGADVTFIENLAIKKAAYYGHEECVKLLILAGTDLNEALIKAVKKDRVSIIKLLIENGADISIDDYKVLKEAIYRKKTEIVKILLEAEGNDLSSVIKNPEDFYTLAISRNYHEIVKLLIDARFPISDKFKKVYLNNAVLQNQKEIVKHLLDVGVEPYIDVFMNAISISTTEIVELFLNTGVDVKERNDEILAILIIPGHEKMLELFTERKLLDVTVRNNKALKNAIDDLSLPIIELLVKAGADINALDIDDIVYLGVRGKFQIIRFLFENGFKITYGDYLRNYFKICKIETDGNELIFNYIRNRLKIKK